MRKDLSAAVGLIALAAFGCHFRSTKVAAPPASGVARDAAEGTFGRKLEVALGADDMRSLHAFRFEVPAAGGISATATPADPRARLSVAIYGSAAAAIAMGEAGKKVEAKDLQRGTYYVAVIEPEKGALRTQVELRVLYKPRDADAAHTACKTPATARELAADKPVEDQVDYSAQRRTCFWHLALQGEGSLKLRFDNQGNGISADFVPPHGSLEKIDPVGGLSKSDLPAGDYYVKVYANDAGDAGTYNLATSFEEADTCKNGGPTCSLEGAEELKLPSDSKTADVDYGKRKQFHFYRVALREKGKLTLTFRIQQPPRGSRLQAFFMRGPEDGGERIPSPAAITKDVDGPGDYYVRVQAPDPGDFGRYSVGMFWSPANFIPAEVVEIGRAPCLLTVSAGANQGVRPGVACTVVSASGQPLDSCVVDQTFPNLSKVRPGNARCNLQTTARVQINQP
jgi:hypothetical protein